MNTARLETFADGVFAIAATLLIIDVTADARGGALGHAVLSAWPEYAAYGVSFVTIGIMWINHHTMMDQIQRADRRFLIATIGLLMCIAFVPFPTRVVAEHIRGAGAQDAALLYGFTLVVTAIMFNVNWLYASRSRRLLRPDAGAAIVSGVTRSYLPGPYVYLGATLVAFASPDASVILFMAIAFAYIVESSIFGAAEGH